LEESGIRRRLDKGSCPADTGKEMENVLLVSPETRHMK
jgi:hypothetical protein